MAARGREIQSGTRRPEGAPSRPGSSLVRRASRFAGILGSADPLPAGRLRSAAGHQRGPAHLVGDRPMALHSRCSPAAAGRHRARPTGWRGHAAARRRARTGLAPLSSPDDVVERHGSAGDSRQSVGAARAGARHAGHPVLVGGRAVSRESVFRDVARRSRPSQRRGDSPGVSSGSWLPSAMSSRARSPRRELRHRRCSCAIPPAAERRRLLGRLLRNLDRVQSMVTNLLESARLDEGEFAPARGGGRSSPCDTAHARDVPPGGRRARHRAAGRHCPWTSHSCRSRSHADRATQFCWRTRSLRSKAPSSTLWRCAARDAARRSPWKCETAAAASIRVWPPS